MVATSYLEFPYLQLKFDSNFNVLDSIDPWLSICYRSMGTIEPENSEIFMNDNAKNKLQELVRDLGGCIHSCINFQHSSISSPRSSSVMVTFPDGRIVRGTGVGQSKPDADIAAARNALDRVKRIYPYLLVDWKKLGVEAQAGDALIKLGVYLSAESKSAADNSNQLQISETDAHLAKVFDRWKAQNDPDLAIWGNDLGAKRKATLVEALLWRRYGQNIIAANAPAQLTSLLRTLRLDS